MRSCYIQSAVAATETHDVAEAELVRKTHCLGTGAITFSLFPLADLMPVAAAAYG